MWSNNYPGTPPGGPWLPPAQGAVGWHVNKSTATPDLYGAQYALGNMPGLALSLTGSLNTEYNPGYVEYALTAPGTTKISSASITQSWRDKIYRADHCTQIGLRTGSEQRATDYHCNPPEGTDQGDGWYKRDLYLEDPSATPTAKEVFFKLVFPDCKNPPSNPQPSCSKNIPPLDPISNGWTTRMERVDLVLVDDDLPEVEASGPFYDLDETYINGQLSYDLAVTASDAGAGVKRVTLDRTGYGTGAGEFMDAPAPCDVTHNTESLDSRVCPMNWNTTLSVDTSSLSEGRHDFRALAQDPAQNVGRSEPDWTIYVDQHAPGVPTGFEAGRDEDTGTANVTWDPGEDPDLSDESETEGSGYDHDVYRYRHGARQVDGSFIWGAWSALATTEDSKFQTGQVTIGDQIQVRAKSVDSVGNASEVVDAIIPVTIGDDDSTNAGATVTYFSPRYDEDGLFVVEDDSQTTPVLETGGTSSSVTTSSSGSNAQVAHHNEPTAEDRIKNLLPNKAGGCSNTVKFALRKMDGNDVAPRVRRLRYPTAPAASGYPRGGYFQKLAVGPKKNRKKKFLLTLDYPRAKAAHTPEFIQQPAWTAAEFRLPYLPRFVQEKITAFDPWRKKLQMPCARQAVNNTVEVSGGAGALDRRKFADGSDDDRPQNFTIHRYPRNLRIGYSTRVGPTSDLGKYDPTGPTGRSSWNNGLIDLDEAQWINGSYAENADAQPRLVAIRDSKSDPIMYVARTSKCQMSEASILVHARAFEPQVAGATVTDAQITGAVGAIEAAVGDFYNVYLPGSNAAVDCVRAKWWKEAVGGPRWEKNLRMGNDIQGYGCMTDSTDRAQHQLISFNATSVIRQAMLELKRGTSLSVSNHSSELFRVGIRGFVRHETVLLNGSYAKRSLWLQTTNANGNGSIDVNFNHMPDPGCGRGAEVGSDLDLGDDAQHEIGAYYRNVTTNAPVQTYKPYGLQSLQGRLPAGSGYHYVMTNTTGLRGGGIVRGVYPVSARFKRTDWFDYCDPNGAGVYGDVTHPNPLPPPALPRTIIEYEVRTVKPRAHWSYGRVLNIGAGSEMWGWVPTGLLRSVSDGTPASKPVRTNADDAGDQSADYSGGGCLTKVDPAAGINQLAPDEGIWQAYFAPNSRVSVVQ